MEIMILNKDRNICGHFATAIFFGSCLRVKVMKTVLLLFLFLLILSLTTFTALALDRDDGPPLNYLKSNYKAAVVVAQVRVLDASSVNKVGGYENWQITSEVIKSFKGGPGKGAEVKYIEPTESGFRRERFLGEKIIFLKDNYSAIENSTVPATKQVSKNLKIIQQAEQAKKKPNLGP